MDHNEVKSKSMNGVFKKIWPATCLRPNLVLIVLKIMVCGRIREWIKILL